ncbi:hypothetical protein MASSI9I_40050 [Massilia sp. 9I]|nr:hypothetical protein MASSI9I_40050 [Massilia sp. 9I]
MRHASCPASKTLTAGRRFCFGAGLIDCQFSFANAGTKTQRPAYATIAWPFDAAQARHATDTPDPAIPAAPLHVARRYAIRIVCAGAGRRLAGHGRRRARTRLRRRTAEHPDQCLPHRAGQLHGPPRRAGGRAGAAPGAGASAHRSRHLYRNRAGAGRLRRRARRLHQRHRPGHAG